MHKKGQLIKLRWKDILEDSQRLKEDENEQH